MVPTKKQQTSSLEATNLPTNHHRNMRKVKVEEDKEPRQDDKHDDPVLQDSSSDSEEAIYAYPRNIVDSSSSYKALLKNDVSDIVDEINREARVSFDFYIN